MFLIDRRFLWAAGYSAFGACLAAIGLIHGAEVHFFESPKIALGYAFLGVLCLAFHALGVAPREIDETDPVDVEDATERGILLPEPVAPPRPAAAPGIVAPAGTPVGV